MTTPLCEFVYDCDRAAIARAEVKAWTLTGLPCSVRLYMCEECRRVAESRGDIVPGAEIEVL